MRNFSKILMNSFMILLFVTIMLVAFVSPYFLGEFSSYQDQKVRKSLSGKLDTLYVGTSNALRAFVPTVIDKELGTTSYNLANPLMSMYGVYTMAEKEINRNPVKTLVIELSYNTMTIGRDILGLEGDLYTFGRLDTFKEKMKYASNTIFKSNYKDFFSGTVQISVRTWKQILFGESETKVQYKTRGYLPVETNDLSITKEKANSIIDTKEYDTKFLDENLKELDKMMDLCKKKNIRVIFVVTPIVDYAILEHSNHDDIFSQYIELAKKYNCEYYDFNLDKKSIELYTNEKDFYDDIHLSDPGAKKFSKRYSEIISTVDKGKKVEKEFYKSYGELKENIIKAKYSK